MSNFFEQELRKLFGDGAVIQSPHFAGQVCMGTLNNGLRVRAQFVSPQIAEHYDALKITVLNHTDGPVDALSLKLDDIWGKKPVPGNPNFKDGVSPYIGVYNGKTSWYTYQPTQADRKQLLEAVKQYLEPFREQTRSQNGPKLVYICAPLRGDVEQNIAFARQKAKEVFLEGKVPVCPHLMFPPFADPADPVQDQMAREMGLRLIEVCQEVRVYGEERTVGMQAEIRHAMEFGVPVKEIGEKERSAQPRRPMALVGEKGNIFAIMSRASALLGQAGQKEQVNEMFQRVADCGSYEEAIRIVSEYVEIERPKKSSPKKARNAHER